MGVEKVADRGAGDPFCEDPAGCYFVDNKSVSQPVSQSASQSVISNEEEKKNTWIMFRT